MRTRTVIGSFAAAIAVVAAAAAFSHYGGDTDEVKFRTEKVERGALRSTVSASGTLGAVTTVEVGSQVSGQVLEVNVDFNSKVVKDQVIARLDPAKMQAKVSQVEAQLALARANVAQQTAAVARARADILKARAGETQSRTDLERKRALSKSGFTAKIDMDKAVMAHDQAGADVASSEAALAMALAQVETAKATVRQMEATLQDVKLDLEHTTIRSPVSGVVVERAVDPGLTVAASFQAPKLFTIAQDLREMQVLVNVDEADIGRVHQGQRVSFTVDSFPDRQFQGRVGQVRLAPQVVQNVTTYIVVVSADNGELKLMPGMTANVRIVTDERTGAVKVPDAALRFRPQGVTATSAVGGPAERPAGRPSQQEQIERMTRALSLTADQQAKVRDIFKSMGEMGRTLREQGVPPQEMGARFGQLRQKAMAEVRDLLTDQQKTKFDALRSGRGQQQAATVGRVYIAAADGTLKPVELRLGLDDGTATEVLTGALKPGDEVVTGIDKTKPAASASRFRGLRL
jgi:HlyD family secretion protein